jgi:hypothetical protein
MELRMALAVDTAVEMGGQLARMLEMEPQTKAVVAVGRHMETLVTQLAMAVVD